MQHNQISINNPICGTKNYGPERPIRTFDINVPEYTIWNKKDWWQKLGKYKRKIKVE